MSKNTVTTGKMGDIRNSGTSPAAGSRAKAGDPVNMATGEYIYEDKDFILPGMGGDQ